jgi:Glycosyl transferase family 2
VRFTVVCSVRDEGPYLVEWVSWYRMLGFTDIVIVTNDCTDRSPELLDALAAAGWITHLRHDVPDSRHICSRKLRAARALPEVREADWVLVCDVDEFLVIHRGQGRITDLIPEDADFLGMSINWRVFGTSGREVWEDGLTHRQFTRAALSRNPVSVVVKSIARHPEWFANLGEHGPKRLDLAKAGLPWGAPGMRWVNAEGETVPSWQPGGDYLRRLPRPLVTHAVAQMNHYIVRSAESWRLKRGSLSAVAGIDRYTDAFFDKHNRNDVTDTTAFERAADFDPVHATALALPGVARLHHLCCADLVARLARRAGADPAADPRWQQHQAQAAALE